MKKFAKIVALALAGTMMLMMTACCGSIPRDEAKVRELILKEINEYRADFDLDEIEEIKILSEKEQAGVDVFTSAGNATINWEAADTSQYDTLCEKNKENWIAYYSNGIHDLNPENAYLDLPIDSLEMLRLEIRSVPDFLGETCSKIGIGITTIKGRTYWSYTVYTPKTLTAE